MARLFAAPTVIPAAGQPPKIIEEFVGRVNSATSKLSIAKMTSPSGWREQGQTPEFDEFTVVLRGQLQVETRDAVHPIPRARSTLRFVSRPFRPTLFIATISEAHLQSFTRFCQIERLSAHPAAISIAVACTCFTF
jgi:hypothetical protein